MKEPCRTCPRREVDYGGCRCQAFALTGDAANTDPACSLSPMHAEWGKVAEVESHVVSPEFVYRRPGGATPKPARDKIPAPTEV
jgi:pyrroloquinoline quinone biosynthesis protein E